jgi:hypothetical protein
VISLWCPVKLVEYEQTIAALWGRWTQRPIPAQANNYLQEVIGDDAKFFSQSEMLQRFLAGNRKKNSGNNVMSPCRRLFCYREKPWNNSKINR